MNIDYALNVLRNNVLSMTMALRIELRILDQSSCYPVLGPKTRTPPSKKKCRNFEDDCVPNGSTGKVVAWGVLTYS